MAEYMYFCRLIFCSNEGRYGDPTLKIELHRDKTNKMACAPSEDSDQPGHPPSLIRAFDVSFMGSSRREMGERIADFLISIFIPRSSLAYFRSYLFPKNSLDLIFFLIESANFTSRIS